MKPAYRQDVLAGIYTSTLIADLWPCGTSMSQASSPISHLAQLVLHATPGMCCQGLLLCNTLQQLGGSCIRIAHILQDRHTVF